MRKIFYEIFFAILFIQNAFPMHGQDQYNARGLVWEPKNCWMTSVFSAIINSRPIHQMLKSYTVKIADNDTKELKRQKRMLRKFIDILQQAYVTSQVFSGVDTLSYYKKICKYYGIKEGKEFDAGNFLIRFLNDICAACPRLNAFFYIPTRDAQDVYACYKKRFVPSRYEPHYKSDFLHETFRDITDKRENFVISSGLSLVNTNLGGEVIWPPSDPYELSESGFSQKKLEKAERFYGEMCEETRCSKLSPEEYYQIKYTVFKSAPKILIFYNTVQYGVIMPLELEISSEFCKQKEAPLRYKLYSIVIDNLAEEHYYNYSRSIYSDKWYKYNYSDVELTQDAKIQEILSSGKDNGNIPVLIFYELVEN